MLKEHGNNFGQILFFILFIVYITIDQQRFGARYKAHNFLLCKQGSCLFFGGGCQFILNKNILVL